MKARRTTFAATAAGVLLLVAACGDPGSGGGTADPTSDSNATGAVCEPVAGDQLVVLTDDQGLQNADNVIPAVNGAAAAADPNLIPLLDTVSESLDTDKLIQLNKSVDIDRQTSSEAAAAYVEAEGLASDDTSIGAGKSVVIGAANFSESATLSEIYSAVLKSAGYSTEVQTIGNRETYLPALESGQITVTPEYAATLTEFLNTAANGADAEPQASGDVDATVEALTALGTDVGLSFGAVSAAQDQNAFAVTQAFADEHDLTTLSDLATNCAGGVSLAGPAECPERPFCQPGLEETYGITVSEFTAYDFGLIGDAVRNGESALGLVLSSDGSLAS